MEGDKVRGAEKWMSAPPSPSSESPGGHRSRECLGLSEGSKNSTSGNPRLADRFHASLTLPTCVTAHMHMVGLA